MNYFKLLECQPEPVEGGFDEAHRLRQAANDTYYKTLTSKLLKCQVELVETGFYKRTAFDKLLMTP